MPFCPLQFSGLYLVSLVVILIGFITFNTVPTPTDHTDPSSSSSICEGSLNDNPITTQNDSAEQEVTVRITAEDEEDCDEGQLEDVEKEEGWGEDERRAPSQSLEDGKSHRDVVAVGCSTKMWTPAWKLVMISIFWNPFIYWVFLLYIDNETDKILK